MTTTKLTTTWQTICRVGYQHSVSPDENRYAHGGVCLCQARLGLHGKILGRKVNSNGIHREPGAPEEITADRLANWDSIAEAFA